MPRYNVKRTYQVGEYWLSRIPRSPAWQRTWFDNDTRQTRRVSLCTSDIEEAKDRLTDWVLINRKKKKEAPDRVTLAELFIPFYEQHGSKLKSAYQAQYGLTHWLDFYGDATVSEALDISEQERFLKYLTIDKGVSANTAHRIVAVGSAALKWSWKRGMLESVPYIMFPKQTKGAPLGRPLEVDELRRLLAATKSPHMRTFILLMIGTAARPDAVMDLTFDRCDFERRLIILNPADREQTKKYRPTVRMPENLVDHLRKLAEQPKCEYVVSYKSAPIVSTKKAWRLLRTAAELDDRVQPYSLRHTMARWLRAQSVPAWEVAAQLGHKQKSVSTTEIYAPFDPAYLSNSVVAIDDLLSQVMN